MIWILESQIKRYVRCTKVGDKSSRSMRKITLVHDNTEEIDFEGKVDSVLEFKNVEFEELKHLP